MNDGAEARLQYARPVIPAKDMQESLAFYEGKLGFTRTFDDAPEPGGAVSYAGVQRDGLGLHLQAMVPGQDDGVPLIRIRVENIEVLYEEYVTAGVVAASGHLEEKPWGSKDFGVYDPNGAALVFYEDL
jgi:catechol 2,3-dioxygenase-like lactoylglutathione lyase family enzyme